MKLFSLPKKFEFKSEKHPYAHNENWISNGHFMIKKDLIKDHLKYCWNEERAIINLDRIVPSKTNSKWKITNIIYDIGALGYLRVFKCIESGKTVCFKDDYIKHFKIEYLLGDNENLFHQFISEDGSFVIMACRNSETDFE